MDWWSGTIDDLAAERYEVVLDLVSTILIPGPHAMSESVSTRPFFAIFTCEFLGLVVGFKSPGYFGAVFVCPRVPAFGFWPCVGLSRFPNCPCQCRLSFRLCHFMWNLMF